MVETYIILLIHFSSESKIIYCLKYYKDIKGKVLTQIDYYNNTKYSLGL